MIKHGTVDAASATAVWGVHRLVRVLAALEHGLSSADDPKARLQRAADLLRLVVPFDRCALYWLDYWRQEHALVAPLGAEPRDLVDRIRAIHRRLEGDEAGAAAPPHGSRLAIPLVSLDQLEGVLLVECDRAGVYDAQCLSSLTVIGAPIATYLANLRRRAHENDMSADLNHAAEFQRQMMAVVGHDLRNPLAAILQAGELLRATSRDEHGGRLLRLIVRSAERASRIIADLLDVTRARNGLKMPVNPRLVSLRTIVAESVEEARARHPERAIELAAPDDDAVAGLWDGDRISQALGNLLTNAIDYGSPEPILVSLSSQDANAIIEVTNLGPAISPDSIATLFDPFTRGRTKSTSRGLGLGLYIVREIAAAHGGRVEVRSTANDGTTFAITMPKLT